jgi:hypothetical protein
MKLMIACIFGLGIALGFQLGRTALAPASVESDDERGVDLPNGDPELQAIRKRLGRPDRVTGSGRMFVHYDLQNGDTLTLIVSGREIIGAGVEHRTKK